jgi:hypothetical protein
MPYRFSDWPYLLRFAPQTAMKRILEAYRKTGGNARAAAGVLAISEPSFYRYARRLRLKLIRAEVKGKQRKRQRSAAKRS